MRRAFWPRLARGNDGHELGDGAIDGAADRAGRAVDVLQRGRDAFEQRDRALRGQNWLESCDLLDLGECFLEPRDGWLRLPSEGVSSESRLEAPGVGTSVRHTTLAILAGQPRDRGGPTRCCTCAMLATGNASRKPTWIDDGQPLEAARPRSARRRVGRG
jgi:hypothetical protein